MLNRSFFDDENLLTIAADMISETDFFDGAYLVSLCIFQFGTLFTGGGFGIGTVAAIVILIGFLYMLFRPYKESTSLKANTVSSVKAASK